MVNYIEPNLQEIIFGPIRVGLITQKQSWDHLKKLTFFGLDPLAVQWCNLSAFEFDAFLIVCNLATLNSRSSTVVIKHDEWEDFIMEHGLSDIVQKIGHTKLDLHLGSSSMEI